MRVVPGVVINLCSKQIFVKMSAGLQTSWAFDYLFLLYLQLQDLLTKIVRLAIEEI